MGCCERPPDQGWLPGDRGNPLRSVASDAASVAAVVRTIHGPVVLVGHSYGGPVITEAANGNPNVKALVYVAGFMPDTRRIQPHPVRQIPGQYACRRARTRDAARWYAGPLHPAVQISSPVRRRRLR
ncbi:alpha/beta fold hydrolase [Rhizobium giardinii]|uniref:alpha/beta fold hydrolase n=1 Tax=Rhizobium giardinii TaxID=56731 RepID=UPI003B832CD2